MPFTKTAKDIAIEDGALWAEFQLEGGDWEQAKSPLENFIGIEDGTLSHTKPHRGRSTDHGCM
jgi:hypothetical protein